jgi:hypothetical protein
MLSQGLYSSFGVFFFINFSKYYFKLIDKSYITSEDSLYLPPYSYNTYSTRVCIGHIVYYKPFYLVKGIPLKDKYYIKDPFCFGLEPRRIENKVKVNLNKEPL